MILGLGAYLFGPSITGLFVGLGETYTQDLNLVIDESSSHVWQPEQEGELDSVRISGSIEGTGKPA